MYLFGIAFNVFKFPLFNTIAEEVTEKGKEMYSDANKIGEMTKVLCASIAI